MKNKPVNQTTGYSLHNGQNLPSNVLNLGTHFMRELTNQLGWSEPDTQLGNLFFFIIYYHGKPYSEYAFLPSMIFSLFAPRYVWQPVNSSSGLYLLFMEGSNDSKAGNPVNNVIKVIGY